MFNEDVTTEDSIAVASCQNAAYRLPFELFNDQLGQTIYEISRMSIIDGWLLGGEVSLARALVKRCGYSIRTARRHIKRLEQSGLLISTPQLTLAGLHGNNLYKRLFN